jgi:hypothetical protein
MPGLCRAPGCAAETASSYSRYCNIHRSRLRLQGAVDQRAVTKTELASYQRLVQARIENYPDNSAWERLDEAWVRLVGHARDILAAERRGQAGYRPERIAAREVVTLGDAVPARDVVVCTLAMVVMWELDPRRFRTDHAFRMQLARRVRRLTEANALFYFDPVADNGKRVYRDLPPSAAKVFAGWLTDTFGASGLDLARMEVGDAERAKRDKQELRAALAELK